MEEEPGPGKPALAGGAVLGLEEPRTKAVP